MSWQDRTRPLIKLVSPSGAAFEPYWQGNSRNMAKKLGIFNLPRIRGAQVQDLEVAAGLYPLTLFFEGADHDLIAEQFFIACRERGRWQVTHPVKGLLALQLVSVSEGVDPVSSGNITKFETEWIEPLDPSSVKSPVQLAAEAQLQVQEVNDRAAEQFDTVLTTGLFPAKTGAVEIIREYFDIYDNTLSELVNSSEAVRDRVSSVYRGIIDAISQPAINGITLAAQIQEWIQLPVLASSDTEARLESYKNFIDRGLAETRKIVVGDDYTRNTASAHELLLTAGLTAVAQVSVSGTFETRPVAVEAALEVSGQFITVTDRLDEVSELFTGVLATKYFSQLDSFCSTWLLTAQAVNYILRTSFDLAIERRFTLSQRRAVIEIVITEYGTLGDNDINYDNFIRYNKLKNNDIVILPAGREVVVYV
jgi:hypothetical protein